LQLALYQRFYCRVARGSAWVVTVTVTERQAALTALDVLPFRRPHTVNMVKRPLMAVVMEWIPHVPVAHTVSAKVTVRVTALVMVPAVRDMDKALDKPVPDMAQVASDKAQQVTVKPDMAAQDLVPAEQLATAQAPAALDKLDMVKAASAKLATVKPVTAQRVTVRAALAQVWPRKVLAANMAQIQSMAAGQH